MKVEALMTRDVFTCTPGDNLAAAAHLMWTKRIGSVPIVDNSRLVGMVTDRDIAMACMLQAKSPDRIKVGGIMTTGVVACAAGDEVSEAEEKMRAFRIRRLPVIDRAKHVVGLLSLDDIAGALQEKGHKGPGVPAEDIARTLRAVAATRLSV